MIPWLDPGKPPRFPDTSSALNDPNGLLAAGGRLDVEWLLVAYRQGIFPWFAENEPIMWWSPAPRTVLLPQNFHASNSLRKLERQKRYRITQDQDFSSVIKSCALSRVNQTGTWIIDAMINAYVALYEAGLAHSVECWDGENRLVGGLYGVSLGKVFFGESMFSLVSNASKLCLKFLVDSEVYALIDCQLPTDHLASLGAKEMTRIEFESLLNRLV